MVGISCAAKRFGGLARFPVHEDYGYNSLLAPALLLLRSKAVRDVDGQQFMW